MKENVTLFCFPYSGSSASFYLAWTSKFNRNVRIQPVEYPGRGSRFGERLCDNMEELTESVMPILEKNQTEDCIFFGHSLGGLVAYETVLKARKMGMLLPKRIFLSGCMPPHKKYGEKLLHLLPDDDFLKELVVLGGMSQEVINNREILGLYLPVIRADYRIYELYQPKEKEQPLPVGLTVLSGSNDGLASGSNMLEWKRYTSTDLHLKSFQGDHFFIHKQLSFIIKAIEDEL